MKKLLFCLFFVTSTAWAATDVNIVPLKRVISHNQKTVTTSGTEVQLIATSTRCSSLTIKALSTNTGLIAVGNSASVSTSNGFMLSANDSVSLDVDDVQDVYIDATVNGEGVSWIAVG